MREEPRIEREMLEACMREEYGLVPATMDYLPIGRDMNAGVYRVVSEAGAPYLLKAKSGEFYAASCTVARYLHDQGIDSVVAPVPTKSDVLRSRAGERTVLVYPYLEGETGWAGMSDEHWKTAGAIVRQIHEVAVPPSGFEGVRSETFDASGYARSIDNIDTDLAPVKARERPSGRALRAAWSEHCSTIYALLASLEKLSAVLRSGSRPYVICHADMHPGNLLRDRAGRVYLVDWDDVMLAPRERDFIFAGEPASVRDSGSPFFEGYRETKVDWILLTYYRYERVIQDLVEDAGQVLYREDLSEGVKAEAASAFRASLEGRNFEAAKAAAAHIPGGIALEVGGTLQGQS
jgi:spectinomycin phosphotransferase